MSEISRSSETEHLGLGVRRYWLASCIAVIETEGDMSRGAVDIWAEATQQTIRDYPDAYKAIYLLQNLSHPNQRLTTYGRQKTEEIYKSVILTRPLYVAMVLQNTIVNQVVSVFVRLLNRAQPLLTLRIFTSMESATHWLQEQAAGSS